MKVQPENNEQCGHVSMWPAHPCSRAGLIGLHHSLWALDCAGNGAQCLTLVRHSTPELSPQGPAV